jgi:DNA-binding winged helix-turn-helix (wHTH) protein
MTLTRWGDVHAVGKSCARAGERVTLEQLRYCLSVLITSAIETVTRDMIQKTWQEIEFCLDVSRATNGTHIEMY